MTMTKRPKITAKANLRTAPPLGEFHTKKKVKVAMITVIVCEKTRMHTEIWLAILALSKYGDA
jgi:hypothetical protein